MNVQPNCSQNGWGRAKIEIDLPCFCNLRVAQGIDLYEFPVSNRSYEPRGRGFDSCQPHQ